VSEGFYSVGLDDSVASDTLQEKAYQHNNKSELKEAKYKNTSVPAFSSQLVPDDASFVEAYHHQRARYQQLRPMTLGEMPQICVQNNLDNNQVQGTVRSTVRKEFDLTHHLINTRNRIGPLHSSVYAFSAMTACRWNSGDPISGRRPGVARRTSLD
jgi:hypothetical protein